MGTGAAETARGATLRTGTCVKGTMPARAAPAASHGDSQLRSRLIKGRCRHCLSGRDTKKADSDARTERGSSGHAFLLWFWVVPPKIPFESLSLSLWHADYNNEQAFTVSQGRQKKWPRSRVAARRLIQQRVIVISRCGRSLEGTLLTSLVV